MLTRGELLVRVSDRRSGALEQRAEETRREGLGGNTAARVCSPGLTRAGDRFDNVVKPVLNWIQNWIQIQEGQYAAMAGKRAFFCCTPDDAEWHSCFGAAVSI